MAKHRYGQGSVYFDDKRGLYVGQVEFGFGPDGRRLYKRVTSKSQKRLNAKMDELREAKNRDHLPPDRTMSTKEWLTFWLDEVLPGEVKPSTVTNYRDITTAYLVPHLGRVRLVNLGPEHVVRMMNRLRADGLSARTIALARTVLRRAMGDALRWKKVSDNAVALTRAPKKAESKLDDALDAEEAAKVLQSAVGDRLEALAVLVLTVGLRQGETIRLRWDDVDLENATLTVTDAKTDAGRRTIALPGFVVSALRSHQRAQRVERMAAAVWRDPDLVFASTTGTPLDSRNLLRWWHDLTVRAGVGRRRFHASRHTAATLMLNAGVPLEVVSKTLGHAGLAITADVYAKVRPELQRTAADAMERVLG
jgi:integrase